MTVLAVVFAAVLAAAAAAAAMAAVFSNMAKAKDAAMRDFVAAKEQALDRAVESLRGQFAVLAARQLKEQGGDLARMNKEQLDIMLAPLKEQVRTLQESTRKAESERASLGRSMAESVGAIGAIANGLAKTASALSSDVRVQGRKGEDILAEKLRQAGLEENVSFFLQDGTDSERPDAQVCDTENRWLVIDSKVSLTAYLEYAEAGNEETKKARLAAHVASVRQKIDQLARRKYPAALAARHPERNYLPVTAMFVPYEAPLAEALKADGSLWQFAAQNNVVLVTPLTLLAFLRLVYLAWQHEKEDRNRQDIANAARELLARMNGFLLAFEKIGKSLESLQETYDAAKGVLVDSPRAHTIAKAANRLVELNVRFENRKGRRLEKAHAIRRDDGIIAEETPENGGGGGAEA